MNGFLSNKWPNKATQDALERIRRVRLSLKLESRRKMYSLVMYHRALDLHHDHNPPTTQRYRDTINIARRCSIAREAAGFFKHFRIPPEMLQNGPPAVWRRAGISTARVVGNVRQYILVLLQFFEGYRSRLASLEPYVNILSCPTPKDFREDTGEEKEGSSGDVIDVSEPPIDTDEVSVVKKKKKRQRPKQNREVKDHSLSDVDYKPDLPAVEDPPGNITKKTEKSEND